MIPLHPTILILSPTPKKLKSNPFLKKLLQYYVQQSESLRLRTLSIVRRLDLFPSSGEGEQVIEVSPF
jgi:hypothetical protein